MEKIKAIYERIHRTSPEYSDISLIVGKNLFALFGFLYFSSYLFTIGGFSIGIISLETWSAILYFLFPIFCGSAFWLIHCLVSYACVVLFPSLFLAKYVAGLLLSLIWIGVMLVHIGIISL